MDVQEPQGDGVVVVRVVVDPFGAPAHRIVVRDHGGGAFEIGGVNAVEDRIGDLPYLLAGLRLARLGDPVRKSDAQRRVGRIRRLRNE